MAGTGNIAVNQILKDSHCGRRAKTFSTDTIKLVISALKEKNKSYMTDNKIKLGHFQ